MGFHSRRFIALMARSISPKIHSPTTITSSSSSLAPFSLMATSPRSSSTSIHAEDPPLKILTDFDESKALIALSDLLPIRRSASTINGFCVPNSPQNKPLLIPADEFLPVEDKIRGVFLQKLNGKAAIENALAACLTGIESLRVDLVAGVVNRGNLSGEAMVLFFDWAIKQPGIPSDIRTYHVILKALGRRKLFKFVIDMFQRMCKEGVCPGSETLGIVVDSFVRAGQVTRALEMLEKWEGLGLKCDVSCLNVVLQCLCRRGHVGQAYSLFNSRRERIMFDRMTYNVIIGGWAKLGRVGEMEKALEAMVEDGFDTDCLTFSCLIEGLGRAGRVEDAVQIFRSMEDEGRAPDTGVYNAMISNYVSVGDFDECMRYYEQMLSCDCSPNIDTYVKLIGGLLKARKVSDALEAFDEMLHRGIIPSTGTITSFIEPLCSFGPPHAAMLIYKNAKRVGCIISMSAYKLLLMRLSRFGKCGMILKLWEEMQESGYPSDMEVYEYVVNGLCNNGQLESAVLVVEESLQKGFCPSRLIRSKLNNKLLASNKPKEAYKLYLKIKAARCVDNARRYWHANGWHF
ncbi:hypothetical protein Dimus_004191 [Dionaea muscipula]